MSEATNGQKAVRAGIGYTIGNILVRGLSFLTLPLFSRLLGKEQFGIYNVFIAYDSLLYVVIGLALHSSVKSAHYTFPGKTDEYLSSLTIIYGILFLLANAAAVLFGEPLSRLLGLPEAALYLLILYSSGSALLTLYTYRISLDYSYKKYLMISLAETVGNIVLSLALILTVFNDSRAMGRIAGSSLVMGVIAIFLLAAMWRKSRPRYNREYWRFGIRYSLPIIPHGISQVLLAQFDRIMIRSLDSEGAAGIYGLAANIKIVLTVITESVSTAWSTWFFEEIDKGNAEEIRKRAVQLTWVFAFFSAGMMVIAPELVLLLGGEEYAAGKYVAFPMIVDAFVLFMYNVIIPGEYYQKKTKYIMYGTMAAAVINVVTNYLFIRAYGYIAAAYTTLFSYVCYVILHMIICRRLLGFEVIPLKDTLQVSAVVFLSAAAGLLLADAVIARYAMGLAGMAVFAALLLRSLKKGGVDVAGMARKHIFFLDRGKRDE